MMKKLYGRQTFAKSKKGAMKMVYNIYFYGSENDTVVVTNMDGKQLVIDCKKAEAQVIFDAPEDAGILSRFAREEPEGMLAWRCVQADCRIMWMCGMR